MLYVIVLCACVCVCFINPEPVSHSYTHIHMYIIYIKSINRDTRSLNQSVTAHVVIGSVGNIGLECIGCCDALFLSATHDDYYRIIMGATSYNAL